MDNSATHSSPSSSAPLSDRQKLSISVDFSGASTSANTADSPDDQWSSISPAKSALTFAAVWDPEDGMVTFSGARLLDSTDEYESSSGAITPPDVSDDDFSQAVTVDHDGYTSEENTTATVGTFQDTFKAFLHRVPRNSKFNKQLKRSNTVTSSRLDRLDVGSRDPIVRPTRQYSCFDKLDEELSFKAQAAFTDISLESDPVSDEGFFEEMPDIRRRPELKSRWSATTISTSANVQVPRKEAKAPGSHVPHALWIADTYQPTFNLSTPPNSPRRRLKKRRPSDHPPPVSPISYSSSSGSESPISPSSTSSTPTLRSLSLKSKRSRRFTREPTDDSWVSIEITPFITQRIV
ncbi:uncharacterized protein EDB91DRAFT_1265092 [Suillus paluster]|uniref:uncharacterized protein n=1 Tax=Suillus paluster TaxID=48578 RepID=UPI001B8727D0|nr:uncharacterized protein EDB91DRAFT_1265092 [Suillus paluster]KAG1726024.1 hypothetical protein EDB91DRAFT_1265092 [Suillus paluster]